MERAACVIDCASQALICATQELFLDAEWKPKPDFVAEEVLLLMKKHFNLVRNETNSCQQSQRTVG